MERRDWFGKHDSGRAWFSITAEVRWERRSDWGLASPSLFHQFVSLVIYPQAEINYSLHKISSSVYDIMRKGLGHKLTIRTFPKSCDFPKVCVIMWFTGTDFYSTLCINFRDFNVWNYKIVDNTKRFFFQSLWVYGLFLLYNDTDQCGVNRKMQGEDGNVIGKGPCETEIELGLPRLPH